MCDQSSSEVNLDVKSDCGMFGKLPREARDQTYEVILSYKSVYVGRKEIGGKVDSRDITFCGDVGGLREPRAQTCIFLGPYSESILLFD